jgi:AraC family transcriptional regulator, transcriptional activator FtrA
MHRVATVAYHGAPAFELSIPGEVFEKEALAGLYHQEIVAGEPGALRTSSGWRIATTGGVERLELADTIIVPGWRDVDAPPHRRMRTALARARQRGVRVVSLCLGAFALADAGVLDGRRATTHWAHADELARRHPAIDVDPRALYVDEGPVLTSAGVAAGIDLCLHIVRRDHGQETANAVARRMVVAAHRDGGQAQYVERPLPPEPQSALGDTLEWMLANLDRPLELADLAGRRHLSVRQFVRRFKAATGATPYAWLLEQRVRRAQELLETTDLPVEEIATRSGFGTAAVLRLHFGRHVGAAPTAYRAAFVSPTS